MKLFFEICGEICDLLYLPFLSNIIKNEIIKKELDQELDEEKGYEKLSHEEYIEDDEQNQYIQNNQLIPDIKNNLENIPKEENIQKDEDDEDFCGCDFIRPALTFINTRIYKIINDNKSE